jgi:hypothetical protein
MTEEVVMDNTEKQEALENEVRNHAFALRGIATHLYEVAGRLELMEQVLDEILGNPEDSTDEVIEVEAIPVE